MRVIPAAACGMLAVTLSACEEATGPRLPLADPGTVLLQDDFDSENGGVGIPNVESLQHWNVVSGCVDLHGNGFHDVQPGNGLYLDLDGSQDLDPSCTSAGTIESKTEFMLSPGEHILEFWLAGNQQHPDSDQLTVRVGSLFQEEITLPRNAPFRQFTRSISVSEPTAARLQFSHSGGDKQGILLDLIRLRRSE